MTLLAIKSFENEENGEEEVKETSSMTLNQFEDIRIRKYSSLSISNISQHSESEEYKLYEDYPLL